MDQFFPGVEMQVSKICCKVFDMREMLGKTRGKEIGWRLAKVARKKK